MRLFAAHGVTLYSNYTENCPARLFESHEFSFLQAKPLVYYFTIDDDFIRPFQSLRPLSSLIYIIIRYFFFSFFFHLVPLSSSFSLFHLSPLGAQINLVSPISPIFFFPPLSSTHVSRVQFVSLSKLCSSLFSTAFFLNSCASFVDCFI